MMRKGRRTRHVDRLEKMLEVLSEGGVSFFEREDLS
jgi:hypothetical protein